MKPLWRLILLSVLTAAIVLVGMSEEHISGAFGPDSRLAARGAVAAGAALSPAEPVSAGASELRLVRTREGVASRHLVYQQFVNGLPVEGAFVTDHLDKRTGHSLSAADRSLQPRATLLSEPLVEANEALRSAEEAVNLRTSRGAPDSQLIYLPVGGDLRLAWKIVLPTLEPLGTWLVYVDALDGSIIDRSNLIRFDCTFPPSPGGCAYDPNPVTTQGSYSGLSDNGDTDSALLRQLRVPVPLSGLYPNPLGQLIGQYADLTAPGISGGYRPSGVCQESSRVYNYTRNQACFEEVVAYYQVDAAQRKIQSLGFTGIYASPIPIHAHYMPEDNSFYDSSDRGLHFGDGRVDDAEDGDIIIHEYGHALLDYQQPGLNSTEGGAIHEGFADLLSALFFFNKNPSWDQACLGEWDAVGFGATCMRRVDGSKHYPEDLVGEVHADGEIWSGAVWAVFRALGGDETARDRTLRLLLEGNFFLDPWSGLRDAAAGFISADQLLYGGADVPTIQAVFGGRGLLPPPDNLRDAIQIPAKPFQHSVSTQGTSVEPGEPLPCGLGGSTVWYAYTETSDQTAIADTFGSNYDTVLAIYTGPPQATGFTDLRMVACNDNHDGLQSEVSFSAQAGTTYYFQVGGLGGISGNLSFSLTGSAPACGDVDCNSDIDVVDALFILQYVLNLKQGGDQCPPPPGALYLPACDVDCDYDCDAVDALFGLQHVVGIRPELCVCLGP